MGRLAQAFHDRALEARSPFAQRLGSRVRKLVTAHVDPDVEIDVCGHTLRAPLSHDFAFLRRFHLRYDANLGVLAALIREHQPDGTMVDIGANIGDSAAIVKAHAPSMPILCVEGNEEFSRLLHANAATMEEVEVAAPVVLGDRDGPLTGALDRIGGTAVFSASAPGEVRARTLDDLLDRHPRFANPAFVKCDTDGFEGRILAGATRTLREAQPVLMLEYEPEYLEDCGTDGLEMLRWLRGLGYEHVLVYESIGLPICLASLDDARLLAGLDHWVRSKQIYLDLAVFPESRAFLAEELYARERSATSGS